MAQRLLARLAAVARLDPPATAVVDDRGRRTLRAQPIRRAQLIRRAAAVSRGLATAGLRPGERVLLAAGPGSDFVCLALGIHDAGGVIVAMDAAMGEDLFHARMAALAPQWVVASSLLLALSASPSLLRMLRALGLYVPPLHVVPGAALLRVGRAWPGSRRVRALRLDLPRAAQDAAPVEEEDPHPPEQAAFIVFTSGTEGAPKAVVHTRRSMAAMLDIVGSQLPFASGDVLCSRELHLIVPALLAGAIVLVGPAPGSVPSRLLRAMRRHAVTHLFAVPADLQRLCDALPSGSGLPSTLRVVLTGSAPVSTRLLERLAAVLPTTATLRSVYGMTEILPVAFVGLEERQSFRGQGDLVGRPVDGVRVHLRDGELFVSGPHLFAGYFGERGVTEHATGDLARLEGDRIVLLGRRKDMIIRGNFNLYPPLYEPAVERIAGVRRCAMVGVDRPATADERVVLFVEAEPGVAAAELKARIDRELRSGPHRIDPAALPDEIVVTPLPESGRSRKVDKNALRWRLRCVSP